MGWVNAECTGVLDEPGLMERLKAEKFDVMILENFETCGVGELFFCYRLFVIVIRIRALFKSH